MDSQLFFILNLIAAVFLAWWFLSARKGNSKVSSLDLKKGEFFPKEERAIEPKKQAKEKYGSGPFSKSAPPSAPEQKAKMLNVLFMYNGHDWDAYEVLGLPAGCSLNLVTQRYQDLIREADSGKLEFYQTAYEAILRKQ